MITEDTDLETFGRISLADLEQRAALLDRQETKYLVSATELAQLTEELSMHFDALEIDGRCVFTYETTYFDTADLLTYRQHAQGKRRRMKVRSRRYVESDLCFFEVKLKGTRGRTLKERLPYDDIRHGEVDDEALQFLDECLRQTYGSPLTQPLEPALTMQYQRLTLVGRGRPERVTIDFDLRFARPGGPSQTAPSNVTIVEVKSVNGNGRADQALREAGRRSTSCSKYCIGVNLLMSDVRYNRFKPVLTRYFDWSPPMTETDIRSVDHTEVDESILRARQDHGRVIDLLATEFGHLDRGVIEHVVVLEADRFEHASVRSYLSILVHRAARKRLIHDPDQKAVDVIDVRHLGRRDS